MDQLWLVFLRYPGQCTRTGKRSVGDNAKGMDFYKRKDVTEKKK